MGLTWPFVGRAGELRLIRDAQTSGTGIVLAGAPGVGKSRLAREAVAEADPRRYLRLWTAGTPAGRPTPLGAFAPLLPAELRTGTAAGLWDATHALLARSGARRLLLGVDDAHLLDETSAALLHQLTRTRKAFVLASLQSRHAVPDPVRALWKDGLAGRIEVRPLSPAVTADLLVAALSGEVDRVTSRRLWQIAQGNLRFLRELVEAGIAGGALTESAGVWRWDGPWVTTPRLVELIAARIGTLGPGEQNVLEIVAYGEPIGADLLTSLVEPRTVEAMESRNLLLARQQGRRVEVRLAHPLYGEVLRAGCSPERAAALRRTLADAVEATGARRRDDCLRIATWRLDARAPLRPEVVVAAAGRALETLNLPLAERLATTAARLGREQAADGVLARVLFLSHRHAEAEQVLARLTDLAASPGRPGDHAVLRVCNLFGGLHRVDAAFATLRSIRGALADQDRRDELDLLECFLHILLADVPRALRMLAQLRARPRLGARAAAQLPVAHGMVLLDRGRPTLARELLAGPDPAEGPAWNSADIPWVGQLRTMYRCHAELFTGRFAEAGELAAASYAQAAQVEWEVALQLSCTLQAQVARMRGRVRTAARWAREGRRRYRRGAPLGDHALGEVAHAEALAGQPATAAAALAEADRRPAPSEAFAQPWIELARPWVAVAAGDRDRAVELVAACAARARDRDAAGFEALGLHDLVRLGAADRVVPRLRELAGSIDSDLIRAFAAHAGAAAGRDPAGLEAAGVALAGLGADLLAAEAYAQAADEYRRCGAAASDRRLRAQAALLLDGCEGARTPLVAEVDAPQLTARERDIARLAAEGLSNQEIADRMVISSRTVGNHLYHVYAKLGISGRSALAALLPPLGTPV